MPFTNELQRKIRQFHWIISLAGLIRIASLGMFIEVTGRFLSPGFNWLRVILIFIPISWLIFHYLVVSDKRSEDQMLERIKKQIPELSNLMDKLLKDDEDAVKTWNQYKVRFRLPLKPIVDSLWFFLACLVLASMFYILPKIA